MRKQTRGYEPFEEVQDGTGIRVMYAESKRLLISDLEWFSLTRETLY